LISPNSLSTSTGIFERDLDEGILYETPALFTTVRKGSKLFSSKRFVTWMASAMWHALVIYFSTLFTMQDVGYREGHTMGLHLMGAMAASLSTLTVTLRLGLELQHWTTAAQLGFWGSILAYCAYVVIYSLVALAWGDVVSYWVFLELLAVPKFWALLVFVPVVALLPDFTWKSVAMLWKPSRTQKYRELQENNPGTTKLRRGSAAPTSTDPETPDGTGPPQEPESDGSDSA
jgi:magnesium-transporting ATPase (P-type)